MKKTLTPSFAIALLLGTQALAIPGDYQVIKGDTLSQIAKEKYGDLLKWKKLYELNQDHVKNPNLIYPGDRLQLLGDEKMNLYAANTGKSSSDPFSMNDANPLPRKKKSHSQEFLLLPQQSWETFVFQTPPDVDPQGFDRRSKVNLGVVDKTTPGTIVSSDRLAIQGEVVNARTEFASSSLGDQVFIRADEALQVGQVYSVTSGPQKVHSRRDGRVGFVYDISGNIKIIGVRDGLFIGIVVFSTRPIERTHLLIPEVKPLVVGLPIAAPSGLTGSVVMNSEAVESRLTEEQLVFLDVGSDDGVKQNMIFRHYVHEDPFNHDTITSKDFLIESELQVLDVKERFSTAIVLSTRSYLSHGDEVVALTDLVDFNQNAGMQTLIQDSKAKHSLDELDKLDTSEGIGEKENVDLRQLENYTKPVPQAAGAPPSNAADDIKREEANPGHPATEVGNEPAPNDGSNAPEKAPPPETVPNHSVPEGIKTLPSDAPPPESAPPAAAPPAESAAVPSVDTTIPPPPKLDPDLDSAPTPTPAP